MSSYLLESRVPIHIWMERNLDCFACA